MKILFLISIIILVHLLDFCVADKHTLGSRRENYEYKFCEKVLIEHKNKSPKNYDIILKLYSTFLKPIGYIEFDIDSPSNGSINSVWGTQKHPFLNTDFAINNIDAKIHINDTLNVKATLTIYMLGKNESSGILFSEYLEVSRSLIFIYMKNASHTPKPFAQNSIGKRQMGDKLIHFQSRNVTNASRFPSTSFEYTGDVFITYVGFSFNSPTAMALVNTTFISDKEFNAVVYDMNTEHFVANISVYGIRSAIRPGEFVGLL